MVRFNQIGGDPKKLTVIYRNLEVDRNRMYKQDQVAFQPKVEFDPRIGQGLYTLIMVDPDFPEPSDPIDREWLQWMVINIPGNQIEHGQTVVPYQSPQPDFGTHRYRFYLYDQLGRRLPPNINYSRKGFQRAVFLWQNRILRRALALNSFRVRSLHHRFITSPKEEISNNDDIPRPTITRRRLANQDQPPDVIDDEDEDENENDE